MASFDDAEKRIRELNDQIKRLGGEGFKNIDQIIQGMNGNIDAATTQIKLMNAEVRDLQNVFGNIADTIKNSLADLKGQVSFTNQVNKSFSSLESTARKLQQHRENENILSIKQLKNEAKKAKLEVETLTRRRDELTAKFKSNQLSDKELEYYEEINSALGDKKSYLHEIVELSEQEVDNERKIQKTLGLTGQAFKGISGTLSKIGVESETIDGIYNDMRDTARETGDSFASIGVGVRGIGSALKEAITDPAVQFLLLSKAFQTFIKIGTQFSQDTADMARNMGINSDEAERFNELLVQRAAFSSEEAANAKTFVEANNQLNEALGTAVVFSEELLANQTALTKRAGLTAEEAAKFAEYTLLTGRNQEDLYDSIGAVNKGVLSNKKVIAETLKVGGQLAAQYKNNPVAIAQAVTQAQKLGMTLQQTQNVSRGLLDFESSISAELEAELITGKDLNFERARSLALQGKTAEAAAEVRKQVGSLAQFQRLNVIQQEALAKAAGMNADELADSLAKEEQINKLQASGLSRAQAETKLAEQNMSATEKVAQAVDNIKESFASLIAGPLGKAVGMVGSVIESISKSPVAKFVLGVAGAAGGLLAAAAGTIMVGKTIIGVFQKRPKGTPGDELYVKGDSGGGGGGDGSDIISDIADKGLAGGKKSSIGKQLKMLTSKKGRQVLTRALTRKGITGGLGKQLLKTAGKGLLKTGGSLLGKVAAPLTSAAITGEGVYNMLSDERTRKTGIGGFLEGLGGTGMDILDTLSFGLTKAATNAAGISVPGMSTGNIARARAIFHDSGRDPDKSRTPISLDNKQLIQDILSNPQAYPESIVTEAQGVEIDKLAIGGIVNRPTNALVGEAGPEAVVPLNQFYAKLDELIIAVKSGGNIYLDGNKVGTTLSMIPTKA